MVVKEKDGRRNREIEPLESIKIRTRKGFVKRKKEYSELNERFIKTKRYQR